MLFKFNRICLGLKIFVFVYPMSQKINSKGVIQMSFNLKSFIGGASNVAKGALARNLRDQIRVLNSKLRQGGLSYAEEQHIREEIRRREEKLEELGY